MLLAVPMRHLGGAVHFENVACGVIARDRAACFHRHAGMAADRKLKLNNGVGVAEGGVDIAIAFCTIAGSVDSSRSIFARLPGRDAALPAVARCQARPARLRLRRHRHRLQTPRRPARRHSARHHSPAPAAGTVRALRGRSGGNGIGGICATSACGPHSVHAGQRERRVDIDRFDLCRARQASAPRACAIAREMKYRRRSGPGR